MSAWLLSFGLEKNAGLICAGWRGFALHLLLPRSEWVWGLQEDWYDGPQFLLGAGPFALLTWEGSLREAANYRGDSETP